MAGNVFAVAAVSNPYRDVKVCLIRNGRSLTVAVRRTSDSQEIIASAGHRLYLSDSFPQTDSEDFTIFDG